MNRHEFMEQLEQLLSDISYAERAEAIQYYNDYFDDAGVENEQEVIKALGNPAKVAQGVKNGLNEGKGIGEFTETGYQEEAEKKNELLRGSFGSSEPKQEKEKLSGGMIALIVVLCIFASPLIISAVATVLSIAASVVATVCSIVIAAAAVAFAMFVAAIVLIVGAFAGASVTPFGAVLLIGIAFVLLSVGVLAVMLTVWLAGVALPWTIRGIVHLCEKIFSSIKGGKKA